MNSSDACSSSAVSAVRSIAQRCADDALHCIFACLPLCDFISAASVCHSWRHAAAKQRSRNIALTPASSDALASLLASPLRVHVSSLTWLAAAERLSGLHHLCLSMPHLLTLRVELRGERTCEDPNVTPELIPFPPALRSLTLDASMHNRTLFVHWTLLLRSLAHSAPGLRELSLSLAHGEDLDLSLLIRLRHLELLHVDARGGLTETQALTIKQMASLRDVSCGHGRMTSAVLAALCTPPHALTNLTSLDLRLKRLSSADLAALVHLPALTTLEPSSIALSALEAGSGLAFSASLTTLSVRPDPARYINEERVSGLITALQACKHLTSLQLSFDGTAQTSMPVLRAILGAVPGLKSLRLEHMVISDLRFLEGLAALEELHVAHVEGVLPSHLHILRWHTPLLRRLVVKESVYASTNRNATLPNGCVLEMDAFTTYESDEI